MFNNLMGLMEFVVDDDLMMNDTPSSLVSSLPDLVHVCFEWLHCVPSCPSTRHTTFGL